MGSLSIWHWLIVLLVLVVLFGSKKLPDAARGIGRSMRIFKSEIQEMSNDDAKAAPAQPGESAPAAPQQPQALPPTDTTASYPSTDQSGTAQPSDRHTA